MLRQAIERTRRLARRVFRYVRRMLYPILIAALLVIVILTILGAISGEFFNAEAAEQNRAAQAMLAACADAGGTTADPGSGGPTPGAGPLPADMEIAATLAALRKIESGSTEGNYEVQSRTSAASGAYQFMPGTWGRYRGYPEAYLAPPDVQDAKAEERISTLLESHEGHWTVVVPVGWNPGPGHLPAPPLDDSWWDTEKDGNGVTARQYRDKFLSAYEELSGQPLPNAPDPEGQFECPNLLGNTGSLDVDCPAQVEPMGSTESLPRYDPDRDKETPATYALWQKVKTCFGGGTHNACYRDGTRFEHPRGRACDFGVEPIGARRASGRTKEHGDLMADWMVANAEDLDILYIIWYGQWWTSWDQEWRPLSDCPDGNCGITSPGHFDHVHVSIKYLPGDPANARCTIDDCTE